MFGRKDKDKDKDKSRHPDHGPLTMTPADSSPRTNTSTDTFGMHRST